MTNEWRTFLATAEVCSKYEFTRHFEHCVSQIVFVSVETPSLLLETRQSSSS